MTERSVAWKDALGSEACPDLDELFRILGEENPAQEFQEHLDRCPRCATEAALYREFESGAVRAGEEGDVAWIARRLAERDPSSRSARPAADRGQTGWVSSMLRRLGGAGWRTWVPVAAAVVLALLLGTWRSGLPEVADVSDASIVRAGRVELLSPLGELAAPPTEFRWEAVGGAVKYSVRILEVDRSELWQAETVETSITLPAAIRGEMTVGRRFLWDVTAFDGSGARLGGTGQADFEIRAGRGGR